MITEVVGHYIK